jgi:hypothetical protein
MRRQLPLIGASVFALFHAVMVVSTLIATRGAGEGQAFIVALFDFPLVLLLQALPGGGHILYGSTIAYVWFFSVAGTVLYAAIGFCAGILLRALIARSSGRGAGK